MNLYEYENKYVIIETIDGNLFEGFVGDYIDECDSPNGKEIIVLDALDKDNPIGVSCNEIKSVKLLDSKEEVISTKAI